MQKNILAAGLLSAALSFSATAAETRPEYCYFQVGYLQATADIEGEDFDGDGLGLTTSFDIGESAFIQLGYSTLRVSETFYGIGVDYDETSKTVGLGMHNAMSDTTDFVFMAGWLQADGDLDIENVGSASFDDDGYFAQMGTRSMTSEKVELFSNVSYVDMGDGGDTSFGVGLRFLASDRTSFVLGYDMGDDVDALSIALRVDL